MAKFVNAGGKSINLDQVAFTAQTGTGDIRVYFATIDPDTRHLYWILVSLKEAGELIAATSGEPQEPAQQPE